jgi:hypothetical protein
LEDVLKFTTKIMLFAVSGFSFLAIPAFAEDVVLLPSMPLKASLLISCDQNANEPSINGLVTATPVPLDQLKYSAHPWDLNGIGSLHQNLWLDPNKKDVMVRTADGNELKIGSLDKSFETVVSEMKMSGRYGCRDKNTDPPTVYEVETAFTLAPDVKAEMRAAKAEVTCVKSDGFSLRGKKRFERTGRILFSKGDSVFIGETSSYEFPETKCAAFKTVSTGILMIALSPIIIPYAVLKGH